MIFSKAHLKGAFAGPGAAPDEPQEHARAPKKPPGASKRSPQKWVPKSCSPLKKAMAVAPAAAPAPAAAAAAAAALAAVSCRL